jgi:ELWxxDGT repeat protein
VGDALMFVANSAATGYEWWRTEGPAAGVTLVKDIRPGAGSGAYDLNDAGAQPVELGGVLYFQANDGATGAELWRSDGSGAGTWRVTDIGPGAAGAGLSWIVGSADGETLYFGATTAEHGREPWVLPDATAPRATGHAFDAPAQALRVTFSENVSGTLDASDLALTNLTTGQTVPAVSVTVSFDAATRTASFTFPGLARGALPDGNYRATLPAGSLADRWGNAMAGPAAFDFFVLAGDINRDRAVNGTDFAILAGNFGKTGMTFAQGDLNGDGRVDGSDFAILAGNFGKSLPAPPAAATVAAAVNTLQGRAPGDAAPSSKPRPQPAARRRPAAGSRAARQGLRETDRLR